MNDRRNNNFQGNQQQGPTVRERVKNTKAKLPYGFIPVNVHQPERLEAVNLGESSPNLYSGFINCTLYALNELCVGNKHVAMEGDITEIKPLIVDDNLLIPASTLKGCIANFVAAYLRMQITRMNNRRYSFRPNNAFAPNGKILFGAGIVEGFNDDGSIVVKKFCESKFVFSRDLLNSRSYGYYEPTDKNGKPLNKFRIDDTSSTKSWFRFYPYHDGLDGMGSLGKKADIPSTHKGLGVRTSQNNMEPEFEEDPYLISAETKQLYEVTQAVLSSDKVGHFTDHPMSDKINKQQVMNNIKDNAIIIAGNLIFFEYRAGSHDILTYGKHFRYRWAYSRSLHDFHLDFQGPDLVSLALGKLNIVEELFGYSYENKTIPYDNRSKSGKVHFSFAQHQKGTGSIKKIKWVPRPGSPKPSSYEFYIKQNTESELPLVTYGDPARGDFASSPRLSGRKFYYKTVTTPYNDSQNETGVTKTVKLTDVLHPSETDFPTFHFRVNYQNLRAWELHLLYFALCLGQNTAPTKEKPIEKQDLLCHQIGYGKNYGMGAIKININSHALKDDFFCIIPDMVSGELSLNRAKYKPFGQLPDDMKSMLLIRNEHRAYPIDQKGKLDAINAHNKKQEPDIDSESKGIFTWHTRLKNDDLKNRRK